MNKKITYTIIGIILILVSIVSILCFAMNGQTTYSDQQVSTTTTKSMTCSTSIANYPIFKYDGSTRKSMEIVTIFDSNDKLNKISLVYELYYPDNDKIEQSEAENHAAMNIDFGQNGLEADSLNATYSKLKDRFKISLTADANEISPTTAKYFLLDTSEQDSNKQWETGGGYTQSTIQKIYASKGLKCTSSK